MFFFVRLRVYNYESTKVHLYVHTLTSVISVAGPTKEVGKGYHVDI